MSFTQEQWAARDRLQKLYDCADNAPAGTYEAAKELRALIDDTLREFMQGLRDLRLIAHNGDPAKILAGALYAYITTSNPLLMATAEGFGDAMNGPARERIIAQAERDRDAFEALRQKAIGKALANKAEG